MKRFYLSLVFLLLSLTALAQNIAVKSFQALPTDLTASSLEGKRIDQNGNVAALIKVVSNETGFVFEGGTLGIVDSQQRISEIWVWVPRGLRKITILHPQLGQLRDYFFPVEIEAERTYEMVLTTAKIETIIKEEVRQQYLAFQVSPPNATLEVNDQIWKVGPDGTAKKFVNFGTYTYRVQAKDYHTEAGTVKVDDPNNTKKVVVTLSPSFGWIEVSGSGEMQGASVYIDNNYLGEAPCKSDAISSGTHTVRVAKEMYESYSETVTVNDNQITRVTPRLNADFAEVTLKVDADAEIWVNNEKKGVRTWKGRLGSGTYKMECKQANYESSLVTKEITAAMNGQTVDLPAPRPIYGSLNVESTPDFCQLYLDGQAMGETPKFLSEVLIGEHSLKLTKDGYADYTETVTITKGERKQVTATLSSGKEIQFTCNLPNATLEVDGKVVGQASGTYQLTYGSHSLRATASNYYDYTENIQVSESSRTFSIIMERKDEKSFTVNGVSFAMKLVEGGTFQMGATSEQGKDAQDSEKPVHNVTLSDYYIGETEVTQELWEAVMGTTVKQQRDKANRSWPLGSKGKNYPMYYVSWHDCQEFIKKLNQLTGKNFRLPTEAEWEYAARGGKKSKGTKYAGSNTLESVAWYHGNSKDKIQEVKTKSPNELGLYDMSGNLFEWCSDWYGGIYTSDSQTNPKGPSRGTSCVSRGGGKGSDARYCRVSYRSCNLPGNRNISTGFRLALTQ